MKKNGHEVVPWEPYKHDYAVNLINGIYAGDGGDVSCNPGLDSTR